MTMTSRPLNPSLSRRVLRAGLLRYTELRRTVRNREFILIVVSAIVGGFVGLVTIGLRDIVMALHALDFNLFFGEHLSAQTDVDYLRLALVPALGGLALGGITLLLQKLRPTEIIDPVEANALYGGQLSFRDSARLTGLTVISNACGASVGMEAGYSQFGAGIFASVGEYFHLRREDQRTMVTSGAAAAIAAAFNAPLAGAFYGFELIHSSYTTKMLAPVLAACLSAVLVVRNLRTDAPLFDVFGAFPVPHMYYLLFALLGFAAAGVGILTMWLATSVERILKASKLPAWARPAIGGVALSLLAFGSPQVLGSGHGAIQWHLQTQWTLIPLLLLLAGKVLGSAISLGASFRGGLFSSSLFIGLLLGAAFVNTLGMFDPAFLSERTAFLLVGMGATGAAIIGAPFTMVFLVLESTGDFLITFATLMGVLIASTTVRLTFGYSFSTWRFHLRGLPLRGGHDIGWITEMTAGRLMRSDVRTVPVATPLGKLRELVPLGSHKWAVAVNGGGEYAGMIDIAAVHDPDITEMVPHLVAADLTTCRGCYVLPGDDIRTILRKFGEARAETLPVVASATAPRVLGSLSEAFALKRYTQELERRRNDELGMPGL
ncbi:chloride channel protein [Solirhodobacter olei]|uniref:chloride channel protein n=1 Tax=Solirhodobacter olei TaxID=2493082 RepID=UPI001F4E237A|nr:chloride channel protein [Solirhodobacter olei]